MKRAIFEPRALCARCRRPVGVCVCGHLPELAPSAHVLIVQHPREERMAIGTASRLKSTISRAMVAFTGWSSLYSVRTTAIFTNWASSALTMLRRKID